MKHFQREWIEVMAMLLRNLDVDHFHATNSLPNFSFIYAEICSQIWHMYQGKLQTVKRTGYTLFYKTGKLVPVA